MRKSTNLLDWRMRLARAQYLICAICFVSLQYYTFVFQFMRDRLVYKENSTIVLLLFFHIIVIMLLWSMYQSITSDPGKIPLYWGVIMDDPETKKRRYCLICHQFKPERSHHCSTCARCVLNMDHHCPWIMNCIGFMNRKFFVLMVFYITITALYMLTFEIIFIIELFKGDQGTLQLSILNKLFKAAAVAISIGFFFVIANFFQFHIQLLFKNTTTIETMEKNRLDLAAQKQPTPPIEYDYGWKVNWYQAFGMNPYLWAFPIFGQSGKPLGDGVIWDKNNLSTQLTNQGRRNGYLELQGNFEHQQQLQQQLQQQQQQQHHQLQQQLQDQPNYINKMGFTLPTHSQ